MTDQYSPVVEKLWKRAGTGVGFIASLDRNTGVWKEVPYAWDALPSFTQPEGVDIFFSPLTFEQPKRQVLFHTPPTILFADLDSAHPDELILPAHISWMTSPGSFQAVWFLAEPIKYRTAWAELNRRMTYFTGADRGGWAGSKVLRVPGTVNYKRGGVQGEMWEYNPHLRPYTRGELEHKLPSMTELEIAHHEVTTDPPALITDKDKLDDLWKSLPRGIQWDIKYARVKDRSLQIVKVAHAMYETGVPIETAYHMLWYAPWNKWRQRNNPARLWQEVVAVYEKKASTR